MSSTSVSGLKLVEPHFGHLSILGGSVLGSIGSQSGSARIMCLHFLQCQNGMGVPNLRCLEKSQSHFKPSVHSIKRFFMCGGCHLIWSVILMISFFRSVILMNHWGLERNSMGVWHCERSI